MNIKSRIIEKWNWLKKWWKELFATVIIGALLTASVATPIPETPSLMIDGRLVEFSYTDDNTGEDLIIHTTQENYMNWAGSITVYYSVFNDSGKTQNIKTSFSLKDGSSQKKFVKDISEYNGEETIYEEKIVPSYISSSTDELVATSTTIVEKTITKWKKHNLTDFVLPSVSKRKDIKNTYIFKNNTFLLAKGETKFFKAKIAYTDFKDREEFFIEAFGDKGAYGHLDPWTYEQKFNTLNDGDLNGQDSWTGDVEFDVVQTDTPAEGAKHLKVIANVSSNGFIDRTIIGVTSGTVYISIKKNANNDGRSVIYMKDSAEGANSMTIDMNLDGNIRIWDNNPGSWITVGAYSANTYYRIGIAFESGAGSHEGLAADTYKMNIDGGAWSDVADFETAVAEINLLRFGSLKDATSNEYFWDFISPNYTVAVAARIINTQFNEY